MIRYTLAEKQQTQPILQLQEHTKRLCLMTLTTMDLFKNSRQTERESGEHTLETYYTAPPYSMGLLMIKRFILVVLPLTKQVL